MGLQGIIGYPGTRGVKVLYLLQTDRSFILFINHIRINVLLV